MAAPRSVGRRPSVLGTDRGGPAEAQRPVATRSATAEAAARSAGTDRGAGGAERRDRLRKRRRGATTTGREGTRQQGDAIAARLPAAGDDGIGDLGQLGRGNPDGRRIMLQPRPDSIARTRRKRTRCAAILRLPFKMADVDGE